VRQAVPSLCTVRVEFVQSVRIAAKSNRRVITHSLFPFSYFLRRRKLSIFSPLGLNPEKDRDSSRAAATHARMTNQAKAGFFCHSRAYALLGARGIPFLLSLLMKIDSLKERARRLRNVAIFLAEC
jgi:hypothetical protein